MSDVTSSTLRPLGSKLVHALPFWSSLALVPMTLYAMHQGAFWFMIPVLFVWYGVTMIDEITGRYKINADPNTTEDALFWYKLITLIWPFVQFALLFYAIYFITHNDFAVWENIGIAFNIGMLTGAVGINYAHELMHQRDVKERNLADFLLAMVLYSHFRSEHLLVHHRYVGTPRDPVTARFGESFYKYFRRVLVACYKSAFRAEKEKLAKVGKVWKDKSNPFWRYWTLQAVMLLLAWVLGGWAGIGIFVYQAFIAIAHLELTNYVEHYGLTRKHLGDGKYEHVKPHHSWNADHRASNWLLINLQRHSDHHYKPNRRFPLLQTYGAQTAPQLPFGYPVMVLSALSPRLWKRTMNPRVRAWREMYYPDVTDWLPYNKGRTPMPR